MSTTQETEAWEPAFPIPTSISQQAQARLAARPDRPVYPPLDDEQAWIDMIETGDQATLTFLPDVPDAVDEEVLDLVNPDQSTARVFVHRRRDVPVGGPAYLFLHPGALISMGGEVCRRLSGLTAATVGVETWSVDYRMPPRHPYPAGLDDTVTAYRHLLTRRDADSVVVGGVSAGCNLAAALLLRAKQEGLPMPAGLYLGTPEVDLTESGDSFAVLADADVALSSLRDVNLLYAAGYDLADPLLSPLFGDLVGFPPTLLTSGTRDLFLSNTVRMHRALRSAGVEAQLQVFEAMPHAGFTGAAPEDMELTAEMVAFVRGRLLPG